LIGSKRSGFDFLAWAIALGIAAAGIPFLVYAWPTLAGYAYDPKLDRLLELLLPHEFYNGEKIVLAPGALVVTVQYAGTALILGLLGGLIVGAARTARRWWIRLPASVYVEFVRGIPLLVILLCSIYGLSRPIEINGEVYHMSKFWAAVLGLSLCYAAYMGEIIRAGIESIPQEVLEAAYLEGDHWQVSLRVSLPLATRMTLPAIGNEFIALLKDSSLVSVAGIMEMTRAAESHAGATGRIFESYLLVAMVYLLVTLALSRMVKFLENRWEI
jgi:polar amino acid transport system permease protein